MIDALISGSLVGAPQEKTGASGKPYVSCRLRVPVADGETLFVLATAFDAGVKRALAALGPGDPVSLAGPLKLGIWQPPDGGEARINASVIVNALVSPYHVRRKRDAMHEPPARETRQPVAAGAVMVEDDQPGF
ncbi:single-stranded DNA-binding protein [Paraburkholderia youngii]|uniref:single-stranded DNA-binding protein n=1 Tax=Paraburkholderia youngii TaxID=2782701 RepID=UPI003D1A6539